MDKTVKNKKQDEDKKQKTRSNDKTTCKVPKSDADKRKLNPASPKHKEYQESPRHMNHPRLANHRFTELPTPLLDLYQKFKSKPTNGPLTPPPKPISKNLNRRRQSTPAITYHNMPAQRNCPSISESLNRLAIGKHYLPISTQLQFPLSLKPSYFPASNMYLPRQPEYLSWRSQ
jgi:hypothetical protein